MEKIFIEIGDSYISDVEINRYLSEGWTIQKLRTETTKKNGDCKFLVVVVIEKKQFYKHIALPH